jgi:hypothetical protein
MNKLNTQCTGVMFCVVEIYSCITNLLYFQRNFHVVSHGDVPSFSLLMCRPVSILTLYKFVFLSKVISIFAPHINIITGQHMTHYKATVIKHPSCHKILGGTLSLKMLQICTSHSP